MVQVDADEAQQQPARIYAEDFPEAVVDGVANFFHKPRLRGWIHVYAAVVAFIARRSAGVGVVVASVAAGGPGHAALHVHDRRDVRGQWHLSPGELEVGDGAQVDEACRPLDDLHLHRRQLHPVRPARAAVRERHGAVLGSSGRAPSRACSSRCSGHRRHAGSACRFICCWVGWPRSSSCRSCTVQVSRPWCC